MMIIIVRIGPIVRYQTATRYDGDVDDDDDDIYMYVL